MTDFHFLRPWMMALLAIPVSAVLLYLLRHRRPVSLPTISPELMKWMRVPGRGLASKTGFWLTAAAAAVGTVAAAGPAWEKTDAIPEKLPVVIAAVINIPEDCGPADLSRMKTMLYDLADSVRGEKVSLVLQAGSSHEIVPSTSDMRLIRTYTDYISTGIIPAPGDDPSGIAEVTGGKDQDIFSSLIYFTPEYDGGKAGELPRADFLAVVPLHGGAALLEDKYAVFPAGRDNGAVGAALAAIRDAASSRAEADAKRDGTLWKDSGYALAFLFLPLLLPLFIRRRDTLPGIALVMLLPLQSCTVADNKADHVRTDILMARNDTSAVIAVTRDNFLRGSLLAGQGKYTAAAEAFKLAARHGIFRHEAAYNAALSLYLAGKEEEALSLLKALYAECPEWTFLETDIMMIEEWLASEGNTRSREDDYGEEESFQEDEDKEKDGTEEIIKADKLVSDKEMEITGQAEKSDRHTSAVFRMMENDPEDFLRRRLLYEYKISQ